MQGALQVDDELAAVGEGERHQAARALVVDVGVGVFVEGVALLLNTAQKGFCQIKVFNVGHYNHFS